MPLKSGAFFTHVRKAGTCAGMNRVYYCPSRWNDLLTAAHSQAILVSVAAFGGPSSRSGSRLIGDALAVLKLLAFDDAPTNAMLPRVSLSLLPFARGHRPHLGGRDLEDLLAILSGCRREIARRHHCCPDKKHTHAGVAQFTGSELRNGAREDLFWHGIPVICKIELV